MNWPMIFDLLFELLYNAANSLSGYMLGAKVLGWPEPAAFLLATCFGAMGMVNHWRALRKVAIVLLAVGLSGCAATRDIGYAGQHPGFQDISCKGKIALTGTATVAASLAYGGAGTNSFSLTGDCGDGFSIGRSQGLLPGGNASVVAPPR